MAFEEAKSALSRAVLLSHPGRDVETTLTVDASDVAMGGVIEQKMQVSPHLVLFQETITG